MAKKSTKSTDDKKREISTVSLAVKYRPVTIDDVVGQEATATQLRGMVKSRRFPATIGLFGESGSGKTTIARMIARYVNCSKPAKENGAPCGECQSCSYDPKDHPDVHELNMAINRGIDDIRAIVQSARSMPTVGNKRVFILDEMHACFTTQTNVLRADGSLISFAAIYRAFEDAQRTGIDPNILVMSYNEETGAIEPKRILAYIPKTATVEKMRRVNLSQLGVEGYFDVTEDHPMWNYEATGYSPVSELKADTMLRSSVNIGSIVTSVDTWIDIDNEFGSVARDEKTGEYLEVAVADITVEDNHNFFVVPVGGSAGVLAKNCTPQSMQAILKPLEEPSPNTIWVIATTDPQKLPSTILGRCHKFQIKPIAEESIIKRLRIVAKREGVDFKEVDGGKEILATIAHLNNGRMRDSIAALDGVLLAMKSGDKLSKKDIIDNFARNADADLDKAAAELVAGVIQGSVNGVVSTILSVNNARGLLSKSRWLLQTLTQQGAGVNYYRSYSWNCFAQLVKKHGLSPKLPIVLEIQNLLCDVEIQLNSNSIDENVLFTSRVGQFLIEQQRRTLVADVPKKSKKKKREDDDED